MNNAQNDRSYIVYGSMKNRGGRIIWALEELEQPYKVVDLQLFKGEQRQPDYLNINPHGKVPTLVIPHSPSIASAEESSLTSSEEEVITESLAILLTLTERHKSLMPIDIRERAQCHHWLAYCATELEPPLWTHAKHSFVYPTKRRVSEIFPSCLYEYQRALNHIEQILSDHRPYLTSCFSIADIFVGQTLMWGRSRELGERGALTEAYIKRLKARPAWRRAYSTLTSEG